jgi:predicted metalloprotease with PDZ domain
VLTVPHPDPRGQRFVFPAWIPGSYLIRDFARNVMQIEARAGGRPIRIEKLDKCTWQCAPCAGPLELRYQVYAYDLSVRGAYLDTTRAYFNGTSLFLCALGFERAPCTLTLHRPGGAEGEHWRVATSMRAMRVDSAGFGQYRAGDYDELIDHPFEIGEFSVERFDVDGIPHAAVLSGRVVADLERVCGDLARVCAQHVQLFGAPAPIDDYLFLIYATRGGDGGLEHRASTSLLVSRENLPLPGRAASPKGYRRFLGLASHEYFHLWNVKRIRPAAFVACDLTREAYTRLLWVFEGVTSYYDDLALVRAGVITPAEYLELVAETITIVWQSPGRRRQSLADSSFDAWIKLYKADENAPNALISYYTKGALVALALDLTIRRQTRGARSLDDVMRALWARHGAGLGVEDDGFERLASEVTGLDLRRFFETAVRGTDDPPLAELLTSVGVRFELRAAPGPITGTRDFYAPAAGLRLRDQGASVLVASVLDEGPGQATGLAGGDEIIAVDGIRVAGAARLIDTLSANRSGELVRLHVFRRDELYSFELTLRDAPADACRLTFAEEASGEQLSARAAWLNLQPARA